MKQTIFVLLTCVSVIRCTSNDTQSAGKTPAGTLSKDAGQVQEKKKPNNPYSGLTPVEIGKHEKSALHVAFSPDGSLLVSTGKDKLVKIWSVADGKLLHSLAGHEDDVMMADFSPDGKLIVSVSKDQTARIWNVATGKQVKVLKDKPPREKDMTDEELQIYAATPKPLMNWATFTKDGTKVMTAGDDFALKLWNVKTGKKEAVFQDLGCRQRRVYRRKDAPGWVSSAGCMDDGVSYLKFWNVQGNMENQQGDENHDAHFLAFDKAGRWIVTADGSVSFSVYSGQGSYLKRIMVGAYHFCVVFGPDDKTLLVGADGGKIYVYEPGSWRRKGIINVGTRAAVDDLAISPADGTLAVALRDGKVLHFGTPIR
jgi:WD40 repeat protein